MVLSWEDKYTCTLDQECKDIMKPKERVNKVCLLNILIIGRHTGHGKRRGTKDARMPQKVLWMRRQRVLRRLLRKYRDAKKITKDM